MLDWQNEPLVVERSRLSHRMDAFGDWPWRRVGLLAGILAAQFRTDSSREGALRGLGPWIRWLKFAWLSVRVRCASPSIYLLHIAAKFLGLKQLVFDEQLLWLLRSARKQIVFRGLGG